MLALCRNVDQRPREALEALEALQNFDNRGTGRPSPSQPHNLANRGQLSQREVGGQLCLVPVTSNQMEDGTRQKEPHSKRSFQKEVKKNIPSFRITQIGTNQVRDKTAKLHKKEEKK